MSWTRTSQPLNTVHLSSKRYAVMHFTMENDFEKYDLNPPYQRGSVWTAEQRVNLIRSLLMGVPIGAIITNKRTYSTERNVRLYGTGHIYGVVDGKQRIETILAFSRGEFSVPADWWEDRAFDPEKVAADGTITYDALTSYGERVFEMLPVPTEEAQVVGLRAEAEVFGLVNSTGTAQSEEDLTRAEQIARA